VGFILFLILLWIVFAALRKTSKSGDIPPNLVILIVGAFALVAIAALSDKPLGSRFGDYFLALFAGFAYTANFTHRLRSTSRASQERSLVSGPVPPIASINQ